MPNDSDSVIRQVPADWLSVLRCVICAGRARLEEVPREAGAEMLRIDGELAGTCLKCVSCSHCYPVTADGIPLIWTAELRGCLLDAGATGASPMSANVSVYDQVSNDYARYWRKHERNARRVQAAAGAALGGRPESGATPQPLRHLDVGCGPGHVLHWLSGLAAQRCGVDVSLGNLRNARKATGAFVVLASADRLPFADGAFDLVTESSVLHHVEKWDEAVAELARACAAGGGVVIDSEPSRESKRWNRLATAVFQMRWYPYVLLSYVNRRKFWFRDARTARLTFERAEIHNRPNTGLPLDRLVAILEDAGMGVCAVRSPDTHLEPRAWMSWQEMLLHTLSGHNPLDPRWGWVTVVGHRGDGTRREDPGKGQSSRIVTESVERGET